MVICTRGVAGLTEAKQPLGTQLRDFRSACGCLKASVPWTPLRLRISLLKILLRVASSHVRTRVQLRPSCFIQKLSHSAQVPKASASLRASLLSTGFRLQSPCPPDLQAHNRLVSDSSESLSVSRVTCAWPLKTFPGTTSDTPAFCFTKRQIFPP